MQHSEVAKKVHGCFERLFNMTVKTLDANASPANASHSFQDFQFRNHFHTEKTNDKPWPSVGNVAIVSLCSDRWKVRPVTFEV